MKKEPTLGAKATLILTRIGVFSGGGGLQFNLTNQLSGIFHIYINKVKFILN